MSIELKMCAKRVDELTEQNAELLAALKDAARCGMVPVSSAKTGGANRHSEQCRVADQIREAITKAENSK